MLKTRLYSMVKFSALFQCSVSYLLPQMPKMEDQHAAILEKQELKLTRVAAVGFCYNSENEIRC